MNSQHSDYMQSGWLIATLSLVPLSFIIEGSNDYFDISLSRGGWNLNHHFLEGARLNLKTAHPYISLLPLLSLMLVPAFRELSQKTYFFFFLAFILLGTLFPTFR